MDMANKATVQFSDQMTEREEAEPRKNKSLKLGLSLSHQAASLLTS